MCEMVPAPWQAAATCPRSAALSDLLDQWNMLGPAAVPQDAAAHWTLSEGGNTTYDQIWSNTSLNIEGVVNFQGCKSDH